MDAIEIQNLSKTFDGAVKALNNVSFTVKKGEIFGLLGSNGAGKTTLISILVGLLSRDSGDVKMLGLDLDSDRDTIHQKINIVSGFTMVSMTLSVTEYLRYFSYLYDIKDKGKVASVIKTCALEQKKDVLVKDLSSGYKQRLLLAKALLNDPAIILMDEPTVGLDVGMAIKIRKIITSLKKKGTSIIFTSHNLSEVEQLCDRIALISLGKIIEIGSISDIKRKIKNNKILEVVCKRTQDFVNMVSRWKMVKKAQVVGGRVIVEAKQAKDIDTIMRRAVDSDHIIISIRKIEPTLEEAFLKIIEGDSR